MKECDTDLAAISVPMYLNWTGVKLEPVTGVQKGILHLANAKEKREVYRAEKE